MLWLNFVLYLFVIGGTVMALFVPTTLLLNHILCVALWCGIVWLFQRGDMSRLIISVLLSSIYLVSSALSIYPRLSIEVMMHRLFYLAVLIIAWKTSERNEGARYIAHSLLFACSIEVLLALIQWLTWLPNRPPGEPFVRVITGTLNHPNDLSMFLVLALPLWIAMPVEEKRLLKSRGWSRLIIPVGAIGTVITTFCLLLTCSRSGYLGMMTSALSFLALAFKWRRKASVKLLPRGFVPIAVASCIVLLIGILLIPGNWVLRRLVAMFTHIDISVLNRFAMWKYTAHMIMERWAIGYGAGCYPLAYPKFIPQDGVREVFLHPHNLYLHTASEVGVIGLLSIAAFVAFCLCAGYRHISSLKGLMHGNVSAYKVAAWCACIGFLAGSLGNSELEIVAIMCAFMMLLGICAANPPSEFVIGESNKLLRTNVISHLMKATATIVIIVLAFVVIRYDAAHFAFAKAIRSDDAHEREWWLIRAIELDPKNAYYHAQLGMLKFRLGDLEGALASYRRSVGCFSGDALHWHNIAQLKLIQLRGMLGSWSKMLGELDGKQMRKAKRLIGEAVSDFSNALSLDPSNAHYKACLDCAKALQMEADGNIFGALKLFERALSQMRLPLNWVHKHAIAIASKSASNLTLKQPQKDVMRQGDEFRLHFWLRYRRHGSEQEAIIGE